MTYISNIVRTEGDPKVLRSGPSSLTAPDRLGKMLGWFSLGLGLIELIAPHRITRALGMEGQEALVRAYGAREISSGMLSLSTEKNLGLWSRVGGDGLDIATLLKARRDDNPKLQNVTTALALVAGITLLDIMAAQGTTARHSRTSGDRYIYRDRSGFPDGLAAARSAAKDFQVPVDMRAAPALATVSDRGPQQWARPH
jgi:hypothetical protein